MSKSEREIIRRAIRVETENDYVILGYVDTYVTPLQDGNYNIMHVDETKKFTWIYPTDKIKRLQVEISGIWVTCKSKKVNKIKKGDTLTVFWKDNIVGKVNAT